MSNSITGNLNRALLNNNFVYNKLVWGIRNRSATWRAITGYKEPGVLAPVSKKLVFPAIEDLSGFEFALQFNMALADFDAVDDTEAELDVVAGEYIEDVEEYSWPMMHLVRTHFISDRRRKMNMGHVKTQSLMDATNMTLARGLVKKLNRALFLDNDQTKTTLAGLPYIIDNNNTYGYDRSNSRYADLQSYVNTSTGALTWEKVSLARTSVVDMGGTSDVVVCGATVYNYIEYLCRQIVQIQVKHDEKWAGFGGEIFHYGNSVFSMDTDCPSGQAYGISTESEEGMQHWKVAKNAEPLSTDRLVQANERRGHPWVMPFDGYFWLGCATPGAQWRLDAITAPSGYSA